MHTELWVWGGEQPVPLAGKAKHLSHLPCFPCSLKYLKEVRLLGGEQPLGCSPLQKIEGSDISLSYPLLCVVL